MPTEDEQEPKRNKYIKTYYRITTTAGQEEQHPMVVTFCLGLALTGLISTANGIANPHHVMATIDNGEGGHHP